MATLLDLLVDDRVELGKIVLLLGSPVALRRQERVEDDVEAGIGRLTRFQSAPLDVTDAFLILSAKVTELGKAHDHGDDKEQPCGERKALGLKRDHVTDRCTPRSEDRTWHYIPFTMRNNMIVTTIAVYGTSNHVC